MGLSDLVQPAPQTATSGTTAQGHGGVVHLKNGEWLCPRCKWRNFKPRTLNPECIQCHAIKPAEPGEQRVIVPVDTKTWCPSLYDRGSQSPALGLKLVVTPGNVVEDSATESFSSGSSGGTRRLSFDGVPGYVKLCEGVWEKVPIL